MPRYRFDTALVAIAEIDAAVQLAARRFPEVAIEGRATTGGDGTLLSWVCRAPSESHVRRWAESAHLRMASQIKGGNDAEVHDP